MSKKTTDGGLTWEEQYTGHTSNSFREIASPNNGGDVFVIGNEGVLIHSNDGGDSWELMTSDVENTNHPDGPIFHDLAFYGNKGLMGGHFGQLLAFESMTVAVEEVAMEENAILLYPNPVRTLLTIMGNDKPIDEIQLVDMNGRLHKSIYHPSEQSVQCSDLPNGVDILLNLKID